MLDTFPRSGGELQSILDGALAAGDLAGQAQQPPDPAQVADAVARYRAYEALREFRGRLYECLAARPDALFELADAILCADHAVTSMAVAGAGVPPRPRRAVCRPGRRGDR